MSKTITPEQLQLRTEKAVAKAVKAERARVRALLKSIPMPECKDQARGAKTAIKAVATFLKAA
jgi:hypothetical protein